MSRCWPEFGPAGSGLEAFAKIDRGPKKGLIELADQGALITHSIDRSMIGRALGTILGATEYFDQSIGFLRHQSRA